MKIFIKILIIFFSIGVLFGIYNIVCWFIDNNKTDEQIQKAQEIVQIDDVDDNDKDEDITVVDNDSYYTNISLLEADFKELKKINSSTVGWIKVGGTNINYPFVQANDNSYYLTHTFDKSSNGGGWVFLDYRNKLENEDKNTIIYAHGRENGTMFGTLKNILTNGWLDNKDNYIVKLSTEYENTLWEVFSVYRIPTTNDYLQINFNSNEDFETFTNMLIQRSAYNFNTGVNSNDQILTLSTCYNNSDKIVLHAKLIKKQKR